MRQILFFILLLSSTISFGQFAIITDIDGYTNIRKDDSKGKNIVDKSQNGHLIYCFESKDDWTNIDYTKDDK